MTLENYFKNRQKNLCHTLVFFFLVFDGFIKPEEANDAVPKDDARPPCAGDIRLVPVPVAVDVLPACKVFGVPGGV